MKYKILYITHFPHIGGGETQLIYLLEKLNHKKFRPAVVIPSQGQVSRRLIKIGIPTFITPFPIYSIRTLFLPGASPFGIWRLYKLCRKIKPDVIHLNHSCLAIYGGILGKLAGVPVVATLHGVWDCIYFYQDIINAIFTDRLLPITPEVENALLKRKIVPRSKTQVVYLGIDTKKFVPTKNRAKAKKRWGINKDNLVVTMACRFDFVKDHLTFLKVATRIIEKIPKVKFLIAGDTKINLENTSDVASKVKKQLDDYLTQHPKLVPHVIFTDYQEDILPIYHATDILFSSSLSETLPVTFLEGAACGLPIISLKLNSRHRVVHSGKNGFLSPQGRINLLTNNLLTLLKNPDLRSQFSLYSRNLATTHFSIERYAQEIEGVYQKMLNKND